MMRRGLRFSLGIIFLVSLLALLSCRQKSPQKLKSADYSNAAFTIERGLGAEEEKNETGPECDPNGIFPCSESVMGNIILVLMYGFFILLGAKCISDGSELLLEILDPGIIGGLILPCLGAFPDSMMILMSAAFVDREKARTQLAVGLGTLAGSTCFLLTIPWSVCLVLARVDLTIKKTPPKKSLFKWPFSIEGKDCKNSRWWDPLFTGIVLPMDVPLGAFIMMLSSFSYWIVQGVGFYYLFTTPDPASDEAAAVEKWFALATCIVCCLFFVAYSIFQVVFTKAQERRIKIMKEKAIEEKKLEKYKEQIVRAFSSVVARKTAARLMNAQANQLTASSDITAAGTIDSINDSSNITGTTPLLTPNLAGNSPQISGSSAPTNPAAKYFGMWKARALESEENIDENKKSGYGSFQGKAVKDEESSSESEKDEEKDDADSEDGNEEALTVIDKLKIFGKSMFWMAVGVILVVLFSDPMVDSISNLGIILSVPPFYLAFILTPIASNASETISSLIFASKKKKKNTAITFSQLYGACTMNNTMCLAIFTGLIFFKGLPWDYSAEVLCIIFINFAVGIIGLLPVIPVFMAIPVLLLYPAGLGIVYFFENVIGWH